MTDYLQKYVINKMFINGQGAQQIVGYQQR